LKSNTILLSIMKFYTNLLGLALLMGPAQAKYEFIPNDKVELEAAILLLCNGTWPGDSAKYWDVQHITNFDGVFANSGDCNPNVEKWKVSHATSLVSMFAGATGFDTYLGKWDLNETADVSGFFDDSCTANSSPIPIPIDPATDPSIGILLPPERDAVNDIDSLAINVPLIPVTDLGYLRDRCVCDGDMGWASFTEMKCVTCADIDKRMGSEGVCVPICPPGAENYYDSCKCTSKLEEYDKYENKCLCEKGAYGDGNGSCKECPKHTEYSTKYPGVGDVEDRCECVNYYEVWSSSKDKCVCEVGAYGDGDDDCEKCPKDMEEDDDSPGTGDKEDRCKCKKEKTTVFDDDEDECVCKENSYEKSKDKCYECKKNKGMEGKDDGKGDGDIYDRCQCKSDNADLVDEECKCNVDSFGEDGDCKKCIDQPGYEPTSVYPGTATPMDPGSGPIEVRCQLAPTAAPSAVPL